MELRATDTHWKHQSGMEKQAQPHHPNEKKVKKSDIVENQEVDRKMGRREGQGEQTATEGGGEKM